MNKFVKPKTEFISDADYIQKLVNTNLKKDLHDNEEICQHCHGTGMVVVDNRYGLSEDQINQKDIFLIHINPFLFVNIVTMALYSVVHTAVN